MRNVEIKIEDIEDARSLAGILDRAGIEASVHACGEEIETEECESVFGPVVVTFSECGVWFEGERLATETIEYFRVCFQN